MTETTVEFSDIVLALAAKPEHKRIRERIAIGRTSAKAADKRLNRVPEMSADQIK